MKKRGANTFNSHESIPAGVVPYLMPVKRSRGPCGTLTSPSDLLKFQCQASSSSSDDMLDIDAGDQVEAVSPHHLTAASSCNSSVFLAGGAAQVIQLVDPLHALGVRTPPHCADARQFLEQLTRCLLNCQCNINVISTVAASLGTAFWHAWAELNVVLFRQFSELPTSMLRGYHSFTRAPRAQLWHRFAASQGAEMCEGTHAGVPRWLALLRFLLEHALAAYPTASCVLYTIEVPLWLRCWCARWGHPASTPLRVLALSAYEATGVPSPRALYLPCIDLAGF